MNTQMISLYVALSVAVACGEEAVKADLMKSYDTSTWIGSNYTPAYAANQIQLWHAFNPEAIDRELAAAVKYFGINTLRVYLHNIAYDTEKEVFLERIEAFLKLCDRHGIKPGFVFFDDCWNRTGITLETPPSVPGRHNGRWAALQDAERKDENLPKFKTYVQDVIRLYRADPRVRFWEIYNEPTGQDKFSLKLRELGYGWAKELKPLQPVIACWDDHPQTDIVNAHNYTADWASWDRQADMNPAKGTVFTEAGARWFAPRPSSGAPVEVMHWLEKRKAANKTVPGVFLCWELMVGNSNCRWYWGTPDNTPEPTIPWCGLLWPDCTPVSYAEAEAVRRHATGRSTALLFEDFQGSEPPVHAPDGWSIYGAAIAADYLPLSPNTKMVTGKEEWGDYQIEVAAMLKSDNGNAGLILRVSNPGPGMDQMQGYYVGFDTRTLYLGKMNNNWQQLASFDLTRLACKIEPGTWNRLRVEAKGNRLKVWFNPLVGDPGLRIEYTDTQNPFLTGKIGLRSIGVEAWFDDLVVLP